jgi:hypothetical protein
MSNRRRLGVVGTLALASFLIAAVAFATWTISGLGSGSAKAVSPSSLTIATSTPVQDLYPSATPTGDLKFTISNTNSFSVNVTQVAYAGSGITSDIPACDTTTVSLPGSPYTVSYTVTAGANGPFTITDAVQMAVATADNDCKGATFTIPLTASGVNV